MKQYLIEAMERRAKLKATKEVTGWCCQNKVCVAFYPKTNRFSYFLARKGKVNKSEVLAS